MLQGFKYLKYSHHSSGEASHLFGCKSSPGQYKIQNSTPSCNLTLCNYGSPVCCRQKQRPSQCLNKRNRLLLNGTQVLHPQFPNQNCHWLHLIKLSSQTPGIRQVPIGITKVCKQGWLSCASARSPGRQGWLDCDEILAFPAGYTGINTD